jgi:hypothetical protein
MGRAVASLMVLLTGCAGTGHHGTTAPEPASGSRATYELTAGDIRAGISEGAPDLERCWTDAIRGVTEPVSTRLQITLRITATGTVDRVSIEGDDPQRVSPCIEARVHTLRFPRSSGPTQTTFPILLDPPSR